VSKRKIPKAIFEPFEDVRSADLVQTAPLLDLLKKETPAAIKEAYEGNKTFATIFEINGLGFYLDISRQYWIPALEQCINFMLEEERFEECIPIKKLIDEIKKPIKSLPKKTSKKKQDGTASK
jgi:hypothetical protein